MDLDEQQRLWASAIDSMSHALDHIHELSGRNGNSDHDLHHKKWFIVSAALAAEAFLKWALLKKNEKIKRGEKYHDLERTINALKTLKLPRHEVQLLEIAKQVSDQRGQILHRPYDPKLNISNAAILMLCIVRMMERRLEGHSEDMFRECQDLGEQIVAQLDVDGIDKYQQIASAFIGFDFPDVIHEQCPACHEMSVRSCETACSVCFVEVERIICGKCDEERLICHADDDPGCWNCEAGNR